ncbi:MAG: hypothetical protein ACEQSC_00640 [Candidatus Nanopelagicaceae bacterium]|jgi:hypothetical protein
MAQFTESYFEELFDFAELERTVSSTIRLAAKDPRSFYQFFQRYTYFNGFASAAIARLSSSIGLSRYLFINSELLVTEEADRGMDIAAQILTAAADEGIDGRPVHRALAQLTLKTIGNYAELSVEERNEVAKIPAWLDEIVKGVVTNYEGKPDDIASLIRGMGFNLASEIFGDREYALLDMIVRHENKGIGFDRYLREKATPVMIQGHKYTPWCWVTIHSQCQSSGAEAEHCKNALAALNMSLRYRRESDQQMTAWATEGFTAFVNLQQQLFLEIHRECLTISHGSGRQSLLSV